MFARIQMKNMLVLKKTNETTHQTLILLIRILWQSIVNALKWRLINNYLWTPSEWKAKIYKEIFPFKSISGVTFFFCNSTTGHFSGKFCSHYTPSDHTGSNDTGLKFAWRPGAKSIAGQTHKHTE
jgi:hypothetical protein